MTMDYILAMMSVYIELSYDVNRLMLFVDSNTDAAFIDGAEHGLEAADFNLNREELVELFNKRKEAFKINCRIVETIEGLSSEEKSELAIKMNELVGLNKAKYAVKSSEYQQLIDVITKPDFSFEGNEGLKERIVDLKDEYSRYHSAAMYYDNMYNYLKYNIRKK